MKRTNFLEIITLLGTLFLGLVLLVVKLPDYFKPFVPSLVVLVLYYSLLYIPDRINIWSAWLIGFIVDGLDGFIIGNNALQFAFFATLVIIFQHRIRPYGVFRQSLILLSLYVLMLLIGYLLRNIAGSLIIHWQFWPIAATTAIIWPIFYLALSSIRQRIYKVQSRL